MQELIFYIFHTNKNLFSLKGSYPWLTKIIAGLLPFNPLGKIFLRILPSAQQAKYLSINSYLTVFSFSLSGQVFPSKYFTLANARLLSLPKRNIRRNGIIERQWFKVYFVQCSGYCASFLGDKQGLCRQALPLLFLQVHLGLHLRLPGKDLFPTVHQFPLRKKGHFNIWSQERGCLTKCQGINISPIL